MSGTSHVERICVIHAVDAVPAGDNRDSKLLYDSREYIERLSDPDSVSGIDHRALRLADLL